MKSPDSCILTLPDGSKILIPDSLSLITPYVLKEQNDWFEDEIRFVRRLLQPRRHGLVRRPAVGWAQFQFGQS